METTCSACGARYEPGAGTIGHMGCAAGATLAGPPDAPTLPASARHFAAGTPPPDAPKVRGDTRPTRAIPVEVQSAAELPSRRMANYVLVEQVGKGGMGTVWRGWDRKLARYVAIKFLIADEAADVLRFEREAQLAAGLHHPNIAPIYEFGEHEGKHYLAMEYVDGQSLDKEKLPERELVKVLQQVALAVDYAHQSGVIHRDLKPHNVMLTSKGWPFVMDFGLAKQVEGGSDLSVSGMIVGTPTYMPPEQARGDTSKIDRRSDVYSLGATMYFLLTGEAPFKAQTPMEVLMQVIHADPAEPRKIEPRIAQELEVITMKAMDKDPVRRYQTAAELAEDLRRFGAGESILARPPSLAYLLTRSCKRNPWVFASVMLAAVAVGAITFVVTAGRRPAVVDPAAEKWRADFRSARAALSLDEFKPGAGPEAMNAILKRSNSALPADVKDAAQWFRDQLTLSEGITGAWTSSDRSGWLGKRDEAKRLVAWAGVMTRALDGAGGDYASISFYDVASKASRVAAFRGTVTLRIHIVPWAKLESMTAAGEGVVNAGAWESPARGTPSEADLRTPVVINHLVIDDYEMEFVHPALGKAKLRILADAMENGGEYWVTGEMGGELSMKAGK